MSGVNKVIILGTLGRDPEVRKTKGGQSVANLNIATSRKFKAQSGEWQEETEWHRVTVWGKQAEICEKYLTKGRQVYIEGRLKTDSFEKDGRKQYRTDIVCEGLTLLGGAGGGSRDGDRPGFAKAPAPYDPGDGGDDMPPPVNDDDIPF